MNGNLIPPEATNANRPAPAEQRGWSLLFRPAIFAALLICLTVPLIVLGEGFFANWQGTYLLLVVPGVVVEGLWSQRLYQRAHISGMDLLGPWLAEGTLLVLLAKLISYLGRGPALLAGARIWAVDPLRFLEGDTLPLAALVILVWHLGQMLQTTLEQLSDPGETGVDRQKAKDTLQGFVVVGGMWLLLSSGAIVAIARFYPAFRGSLSAAIQWAVICYFGLALFLLGHAHYLQRRVEWEIGGMTIPQTLGRRWTRWGLLITLGIFLVAALLPAGYVLGLGSWLGALLDGLFFISVIVYFFFSLIFFPFALLAHWFTGGTGTPPPPQPPPQLPPEAMTGTPGWWLILRLVLMWGFVAAVVALVLYIYFRDRDLPRTSLRRFFNWLNWVARSLWMVWRSMRARTSFVWNQIRAMRAARLKDRNPASPFRLMEARTPRARIRRYYLTLLKRAAAAGYERSPQRTPDEYAAHLAPHVPEHETDLSTLTEAFIRARYSAEELAEPEVPPVRSAWQKLRDALRR